MSLHRIVAVSRNPEVQQLAQEYGQEVFGADDLVDALDIVQTVNPDLILFDHHFDPGHIREFVLRRSDTAKNDTLSRRAGNRFAASAAPNRADKNSTDIPIVVLGNPDALGNSPDRDPDSIGTDFMQAGAYDYLKTTRDTLSRRAGIRLAASAAARLEQIISRIKNKSDPDVHRDSIQNPPLAGPRAKKSTGFSRPDVYRDASRQRFFADDLAASVSMVGRSKAILNVLKMIKLIAASRCSTILIIGETGTGKELAAKAIHNIRHPNEQFVAVNCAALTANLLESELFGHVKGSFTGADREKTGLLELAGSGTLLLDEISEMPMNLQAKLLRVLQERTFRKVGGIKNITCNATIIASSNRNLKNEVKENRFRRDIYYRLNICPVVLIPLRLQERRQDIRLLAEYFLKTSDICPDKCGKITSLTELAVEALEKHDWPGNVRELRNVIERAILLETTDKIGLNTICIDPTEWSEVSDSPTAGLIKGFSLAKAECELISRALQETGWQKTRAAALLGITRATLYAKVKQYNIEKNSAVRCPAEYSTAEPAKQESSEVLVNDY